MEGKPWRPLAVRPESVTALGMTEHVQGVVLETTVSV